MKYDDKIDYNSRNTQTIIIDNIEHGSIVLEFGPASGRLTKYLKEKLGCKVYIVELDEEAGKVASAYAEDFVLGDILEFEWYERFKGVRFDYILFADVIEHLNGVEDVFLKSREMLKERGAIIFSTPNIAHNSIIINLLKNRFKYTSTGLLDNTHIHFYTKESIEELLTATNLYTQKVFSTRTLVGQNEIEASYQDLDPHIASMLRRRKGAEIYQYLYIVGKTPVKNLIDEIEYYTDYDYIKVYLANDMDKFVRELEYPRVEPNNKYRLSIELDPTIKKIRLDPITYGDCVVKVCIQEEFMEFESSNAKYVSGEIYLFQNEDAQIFWRVNVSQKTVCHITVVFFEYGKNIFDKIVECLLSAEDDLDIFYAFANKLPFRWAFNYYCKRRNREDLIMK